MSVAPEHRQLLYATAICSGLRAGELRALGTGDLDLAAGGMWLHAEWTKNRKNGFQPLPRSLLVKLHELAASGIPLDLYNKRHARQDAKAQIPECPVLYVPTHCARELDKDLEAVGIPKETPKGKLDFHALRVAYVSFCVEVGAGAKEAQSLARHATPDLTMNLYARARETRLTEIAEAVGAMAFNLPNTATTQQRIARPATMFPSSLYRNAPSDSIPAASTILPLVYLPEAEPLTGIPASPAALHCTLTAHFSPRSRRCDTDSAMATSRGLRL